MSKYSNLFKVISWGEPSRAQVIMIGVITSLSAIVSLVVPLMIQRAIDGFNSMDSMDTTPFYLMLAGWLVSALLGGISVYMIGRIGVKMLLNLRAKLFTRSVRLPMRYFDDNASTEPSSRLVSDAGVIAELVNAQTQPVISGVISMVGSLIILWTLDWKLTAFMIVTLILSVILMTPLSRQLAKISQQIQESEATLLNTVIESLGNIRLFKASTAEQQAQVSVTNTLDVMFGLRCRTVAIFAVIAPLSGLIVIGATVVILAMAAIRVKSGEISMGTLVAYVMYVNSIVFPLMQLATFKAALDNAAGGAERIHELLSVEEEDYREGNDKKIEASDIEFKQVGFEYDDDKTILSDISISVGHNETIALVGESGAGKSTIFSLLLDFYSPTSGEILIGGHPIKEYSLTNLRQQMAYVAQDAPMMMGTIRENLLLGMAFDGDDEQIMNAIRLAQLEKFVDSLDNGLDTQIGERGTKVSGGQRQRIAIARAVLKHAPILLCDEATSSLDSSTEYEIQQAMNQLSSNSTTIIAAHRLSTVIDADKIYVLKKGELVGAGTHHELMDSLPYYRELVDRQLSVFSRVNQDTNQGDAAQAEPIEEPI